jgi:hypothetical protein
MAGIDSDLDERPIDQAVAQAAPVGGTRIQPPSERKTEMMTNPGYRIIAALAVSGMLAAAAPGVANAQAMLQACRGDYQSVCAGTKPGGGRILACLQEQADKLSAPCKDLLAKPGK